MKRLCDAADLDGDGEYLKPHGGRRRSGKLRSDMTLEGAAEHAVASAGIHSAATADYIHGEFSHPTPSRRS